MFFPIFSLLQLLQNQEFFRIRQEEEKAVMTQEMTQENSFPSNLTQEMTQEKSFLSNLTQEMTQENMRDDEWIEQI